MSKSWNLSEALEKYELKSLGVHCKKDELVAELLFSLMKVIVVYKHTPFAPSRTPLYDRTCTIKDPNINQVFEDDLKKIVMNGFEELMISVEDEEKYSEMVKPLFIQFLEELWRDKYKKHHVKRFTFKSMNTNHGISFLRHLDPVRLEKVELDFAIKGLVINADSILELIPWNEGRRLEMTIRLFKLAEPNALENKKLLNHPSTFRKINVEYKIGNKSLSKIFPPFSLTVPPGHYKGKKMIFSWNISDVAQNEKKETYKKVVGSPNWLKLFGKKDYLHLISSYLDFFDIIHLRKVCWGMRNIIDELRPESLVKVYSVSEEDSSLLKIWVNLENGGLGTLFYNRWSLPTFPNDLRAHLNHIKSRLDCMGVDKVSPTNLEIIKNVLKSMERPVRVKDIRLEVKNEEDAMCIIPYVDASALESIRMDMSNHKAAMTLDSIRQLDHWKSIKELYIIWGVVTTPIQELELTHFTDVGINVRAISTSDIIYLKNYLMKFSTRFHYNFKIESFEIDDLDAVLSQPHRRAMYDDNSEWYFPTANPEYYLHIDILNRQSEKRLLMSSSRHDIASRLQLISL